MIFLRDLHGTISNCPIKWEDALVEVLDRDSDGWKLSQRYGFMSGAERAFGDSQSDLRTQAVEDAGDDHGVSHDTTPLP